MVEGISLFSISNLSETIKTSLEVSSKLSKTWSSRKSNVKESLQKLVYPEGIVYDKQIDGFRTPKVNSIFSAIEDWNGDSDKNKKGQKGNKTNLSLSAERAGFEPAIPLRVYKLSRLARSATLTPLRFSIF